MSSVGKLNEEIYAKWKSIHAPSESSDISEGTSFNISDDIPKIQNLIDDSPNKEELELEIKRAIMKYYWKGFYKAVLSDR
ncbi:uncharacterized protein PRCAT00003295001 [Priceomyces carsonii]|uniref:uncharacterized protein n=1 Tax=Priceomyces carsonii TaxID=28549 RepID=UPI002ED78F7A|nr:unnamed protein product [Priceomyces carsonii]